MSKLRVGVLGFGSIGQYIVKRLLDPTHPDAMSDTVELVFVWNRTASKLHDAKAHAGFTIPKELILEDLDDLFPHHHVSTAASSSSSTSTGVVTTPNTEPAPHHHHHFAKIAVDLIIEVCHPSIYRERGAQLLSRASLYVGSPTAFADGDVFQKLYDLVTQPAPLSRAVRARGRGAGLYVPCGALWGASDILKMGRRPGAIASASITMAKPPHSMKLNGVIGDVLASYTAEIEVYHQALRDGKEKDDGLLEPPERIVLYDGPVRELCPMAPNNVNTMACLAMATGPSVGFDLVCGRLVADRTLEAHVIDVCVRGPKQIKTRVDPVTGEKEQYEDTFEVSSKRYNPCDPFAVTASATYPSFYASLRTIAEDYYEEGLGLKSGMHFV